MTTADQPLEKKRSDYDCGWGVLAVLVVGLLLSIVPHAPRSNVQKTANQMKTVMNGKQLLMALRQYAEKNGGQFPDAGGKDLKSANDVFRELLKAGTLTEERLFGAPRSPFVPDGIVGDPPELKQALMPGECHWMVLKHQTPQSHPATPILIENALGTTWPPRWKVPPRGFSWFGLKNTEDARPGRGGAWGGGQIVIGRLDGSVQVENLRPDGTLDWESPKNAAWLKSLTPEQAAKLEYWDVEEKKAP